MYRVIFIKGVKTEPYTSIIDHSKLRSTSFYQRTAWFILPLWYGSNVAIDNV